MAFVESAAPGTENAHLEILRPRLINDDSRFRTLSTGEAKRILLWSMLRQKAGPLILDEPYEHLSREGKTALSALLHSWAQHSVVVVATNQDVPMRPGDTQLTLNGTRLEVSGAA
jgi:ATPase subunit of ABC transporter with duplicated ATPase domains